MNEIERDMLALSIGRAIMKTLEDNNYSIKHEKKENNTATPDSQSVPAGTEQPSTPSVTGTVPDDKGQPAGQQPASAEPTSTAGQSATPAGNDSAGAGTTPAGTGSIPANTEPVNTAGNRKWIETTKRTA